MNLQNINKKAKYIAYFVFILFIIASLIWILSLDKKSPIPAPPDKNIKTPASEPDNNNMPDESLKPPEIKWQTYKSPELGVSIKYPNMVYGIDRCSSQRQFYVPLNVFEDRVNGIIYLTEEYYYGNWNDETQLNSEQCNKIINSLDQLKKERSNVIVINDKVSLFSNPFLTKVFIVQKIENDIALDAFIKKNYGSGCLAGERKPWKQNGVYEVEVKGEDWENGTDLGTTTCPLNYTYKILYYPEKNKLMSVNLGQECVFSTDPNLQPYRCYDEDIINSLIFE